MTTISKIHRDPVVEWKNGSIQVISQTQISAQKSAGSILCFCRKSPIAVIIIENGDKTVFVMDRQQIPQNLTF